METIKEVTDWGLISARNHTYLIADNGKCVAYRQDVGSIRVFTKALPFDKKHRKFKKVVDTELELAYTSSIG